MQTPLSRRAFLGRAAAACALATIPPAFSSRLTAAQSVTGLDFPLVDFHVHLDNSSIDQVLPLSKERGVKFGIVEHAGTKENKYPVVLSNDAELKGYLDMLEGKPVFKGVQAEWIDWMGCFSPELLGQLDYVLSDAMTIAGPDGRRMKLWERGAVIGEPQRFMDRYVDWHVKIMEKEPLDIFANMSWLPAVIEKDYDTLWTSERIQRIVDAAVKYGVAIEINSSYKLPKLAFLRIAKAAGVKFSLGSNGRYPAMGKLDYCIEMAKTLGLKATDMFMPAPNGKKPFQRRNFK